MRKRWEGWEDNRRENVKEGDRRRRKEEAEANRSVAGEKRQKTTRGCGFKKKVPVEGWYVLCEQRV